MSTILGLDASSVTIGWCVLQDGRALQHGEIKLPAANIAARCEAVTAINAWGWRQQELWEAA